MKLSNDAFRGKLVAPYGNIALGTRTLYTEWGHIGYDYVENENWIYISSIHIDNPTIVVPP